MQKLGHVCLGSTQLERLIAFYCEVLQCEVVHSFISPGGERYGAFLLVGEGTFIELFLDQTEQGGGGRFRHLAFQVDDLRAEAKRLRSYGLELEILRGKTDAALLAQIEDPDGNKIEFHQYDELSVQSPFLSVGELEND